MSGKLEHKSYWSHTVGRKLLFGIPDERLAGQWGSHGPQADGAGRCAQGDERDELLAWAEQDEEIRRWIALTWRETHADVVAAVDHAITGGDSSDMARLRADFATEDILLALLTDDFDDGPALARWFVNQVGTGSQRRALISLLQELTGELNSALGFGARIVILGGNSRDESRLRRRLFADSPLTVRWETFEKNQGGAAVEKEVANALRHADAAIIITGTASHILVQLAKESAKRFGVAWTCIEKASYQQVRAAIDRLVRRPTGVSIKESS